MPRRKRLYRQHDHDHQPTPQHPTTATDPEPHTPHPILQRQQQHGNRAVLSHLQRFGLGEYAEPYQADGSNGGTATAAPAPPTTQNTPAMPTVRYGSQGPAVAQAQQMLNVAGAATPELNPDGQFGPLTQQAVKNFQGGVGAVADGVIGAITWGYLFLTGQQSLPQPQPEPLQPGLSIKGTQAKTRFEEILDPNAPPDKQVPIKTLAEAVVPMRLIRDDWTLVDELMATFPFTTLPDYKITPGDLSSIEMAILMLKLGVGELETRGGVFANTGGHMPENEIIRTRLNNIEESYVAQMKRGGASLQGNPMAAKAQTVISVAMSAVGSVNDRLETRNPTPKRREENFLRVDATKLHEIFDTATGGKYDKWLVDYRVRDYDADGNVKKDDMGQPIDDRLPEWCALFTVWAMRAAGLSIDPWSLTNPGLSQMGGMATFSDPRQIRPGDVIVNNWGAMHTYIVVEMHDDGKTMTTIEGNTNAEGSATGGQVSLHHGKRKIEKSQTFFRALDLMTPEEKADWEEKQKKKPKK